jgi:hypothetical protein
MDVFRVPWAVAALPISDWLSVKLRRTGGTERFAVA